MSSKNNIVDLKFLGNKEILKHYKIGFLCSRKVPPDIVLKTYDWAKERREKGSCIVSGFHSQLEKDVFKILIKGRQPIILVLARGMMKRWPKFLNTAVEQNRLLIISPFNDKIKHINYQSALKRNELIADLADEILIAYHTLDGMIHNIIRSKVGSKTISYL